MIRNSFTVICDNCKGEVGEPQDAPRTALLDAVVNHGFRIGQTFYGEVLDVCYSCEIGLRENR